MSVLISELHALGRSRNKVVVEESAAGESIFYKYIFGNIVLMLKHWFSKPKL